MRHKLRCLVMVSVGLRIGAVNVKMFCSHTRDSRTELSWGAVYIHVERKLNNGHLIVSNPPSLAHFLYFSK